MIGVLCGVRLGGTLFSPGPFSDCDLTKELYPGVNEVVIVLSFEYVDVYYTECQVLSRHGVGYVNRDDISRLP